MGDFINSNKTKYKRPEELVVKITVPRLEKIADADMDIDEQLLILTVPETYYLEVKLPYPVQKENAKAQFDGKRKIISVRLPVEPSAVMDEEDIHSDTDSVEIEVEDETAEAPRETPAEEAAPEQNLDETETKTAEIPVEEEIVEIHAPETSPEVPNPEDAEPEDDATKDEP